MLESYILRNREVNLGVLKYDTDNKKFSFEVNMDLQNDKLLPLLIYPYDKREKEYIPSDKNIKKFVANRVVPQEREDIESILKRLGLKVYNPWIICKMTRGMCLEDYIWLAKPEEKFTELHMRYLMEHNKKDNIKSIFEIFQKQVKEAM